MMHIILVMLNHMIISFAFFFLADKGEARLLTQRKT